MKKCLFPVIMVLMILAGCKKDIGKTDPPPGTSTQSTGVIQLPPPTICFGDSWSGVASYPGHGEGIVYNNELYVPDAYAQKVHIFDGSAWRDITSAVPVYTTGDFPDVNYKIVMFTIGNKGYFMDLNIRLITFWEYNFTTNAWRKRKDFPGATQGQVAWFSAAGKGYVLEHSPDQYLWQYDPSTNDWTRMASLTGQGFSTLNTTTSFSMGNKGYVVGGSLFNISPVQYTKQFLEYDPATNRWTKKANFPGTKRDAIGVAVGNGKAYAGGGYNVYTDNIDLYDFYGYDPATDTWSPIASLGNLFAMGAFYGFTLNSTAYMVSVMGGNSVRKYIPLTCYPTN